MPLPLAPIAVFAVKYGTIAMTTYALARATEVGRRDQRAEDALDDLPDGTTIRRDGDTRNVTARLRRVIRLGKDGPGVEIDASVLGRLKVKKV